jgi:GNAT superfamily N-acetyltransferase
MTVTITPLPVERFATWLERSAAEYTTDLIAMGHSPQAAHEASARSMTDSFPDGLPAPGQYVFDVHDSAGVVVGYLWIGASNAADSRAWWVWDIVIDAEHRGKGLGRATMLRAEEFARSHNAQSLGLSVFAFNDKARRLYDSLGFQPVSTKMVKALTPPPDGT